MQALDYFPCYNSYLGKTAKLSDSELGRLFRALMRFNATGELPDLNGREELAFDFIADDIERARENYKERCKKNAENGSKGGRPTKEENQSVLKKAVGFLETQKTESKNKSKSKDKSNPFTGDNNARETRFTPPTVEEVKSYCAERGNNVDAERFIDYYTSNGWMVGKNRMKDWKASVRTWEKTENQPKSGKPTATYTAGDYEHDAVHRRLKRGQSHAD